MLNAAADRLTSVPTWAPVAALTGIVLWAASIWWMVATLPSAVSPGNDASEATAEQLAALTTRLDTLTADLASLQEERDALTARLDTIESQRAAMATMDLAPSEGETATLAASAFFTDGADRYNCRDFASMAEAQETLDVNRPGDPNRIDTNNNGQACEDFKYRTTSAALATP